MTVLETERLRLRRFATADEGGAPTDADSAFVLKLLNQPGYLRFIGDKGVRDLVGARAYLETGPIASYARHGFGLYLIERKEEGDPIGLCGLIRRENLPDVDLGYALHSAFEGKGYAVEAARAVLRYGLEDLGIRRIVAITTLDNAASMGLLAKLGFRLEGPVRLDDDGPTLNLFAFDR